MQYADYLSSARPGVRLDASKTFYERLQDLEAIAMTFSGVKAAYALSGGRELQIFVRPELVDDSAASELAKTIASKIKADTGKRVQVSVIRETKVIEYTS